MTNIHEPKNTRFSFRMLMAAMFMCCMASMLMPASANAQTPAALGPTQACSDDPSFGPPQNAGPGLLTMIANDIQTILSSLAITMYQGITRDSSFKSALQAAVSLYIAIYGLLFMFGIVQATLYDFLIRIVKIGIVGLLLLGDGGWSYFSMTVVPFFNQGTNDVINQLSSVATGIPMAGGASAFAVLDTALAKAISPRMWYTVLATFGTGPYGAIIAGLLGMALGSFLKALVSGMWVYLMAMCLQALLFGMAPIFIACLLFSRTAHLFQGWLGQVIYTSLAPIMLFVFFSFFTVLISACLDNVTKAPVGWTQLSDGKRGSPISQNFWRFCIQDPNNGGTYMPEDIPYTFTGAVNNNATSQNNAFFPIDILMVLVFLTLAELTGRFNSVAMDIARGLAGVTTDLSGMSGAVSNWFKGGGGGKGGSTSGLKTAQQTAGGLKGGTLMPGMNAGSGNAPAGGGAPPINMRPPGPQK